MSNPIIIAVDGTAASGKGTLARRLAKHFGFVHLDSGKLYRLVALAVIEAGGDPQSEKDALGAIKAIHPDPANLVMMSDPRLVGQEIGEAASLVAADAAVRNEITRLQRRFISNHAKTEYGVVVDGRDIGTVVCPNATAKLFVDARPEIRAHRRWLELQAARQSREESAILAEIVARDARDCSRAVAPLKPAPDAFLLDTSEMDIDAAFAAALALVKPGVENALKARQGG